MPRTAATATEATSDAPHDEERSLRSRIVPLPPRENRMADWILEHYASEKVFQALGRQRSFLAICRIEGVAVSDRARRVPQSSRDRVQGFGYRYPWASRPELEVARPDAALGTSISDRPSAGHDVASTVAFQPRHTHDEETGENTGARKEAWRWAVAAGWRRRGERSLRKRRAGHRS